MRPAIRCATMPNGDIEAAWYDNRLLRRVVIEPRTGNVVTAYQAEVGSDPFRWLVQAARACL